MSTVRSGTRRSQRRCGRVPGDPDGCAHWPLLGRVGADLMAITQTHAWVLMATQRLLHAAAETGAIDKDQFKERLYRTGGQPGQLGNLATTWQNLTPPSAQRIAPNLVEATHKTRAALLELVQGRTGPASATTIATRADLVDIARTLQQTISASVDLAHALLAATGDSALTVDARAALIMSTELDSHRPGNGAENFEAAVDANDVVSNRQIWCRETRSEAPSSSKGSWSSTPARMPPVLPQPSTVQRRPSQTCPERINSTQP